MTSVTTTNTVTDPVAANDRSPIVTGENNIVSSPIVEGNPPAPSTESTPAPAPEGTPAPEGEPAAPAATTGDKTVPEWMQKRINEITGKRYEAERKADAEREGRIAAENRAKELLEQVQKPGTPAPAPSAAVSEEEIERRAAEKAVQIAQANEFNKACNNIVAVGKKEFAATWDQAVQNLTLVGAVGKDASPEFLETVVELNNAPKILNYLGTHMDEGARIAALPPKKMAMELARIEATLNAPPAPVVVPPLIPISGAPAPLIPVAGSATPAAPALDDPSITNEQWMALRAKQVDDRKNRYRRA